MAACVDSIKDKKGTTAETVELRVSASKLVIYVLGREKVLHDIGIKHVSFTGMVAWESYFEEVYTTEEALSVKLIGCGCDASALLPLLCLRRSTSCQLQRRRWV